MIIEKKISATTSEIADAISDIEPALIGKSQSLAILALLSLVFIIQDQDIDVDTLIDNVRATSQFISDRLQAQALPLTSNLIN